MEKKQPASGRKQKVYQDTTTCKLGEIYSVNPQFTKSRDDSGETMRGKVVFIPKHRRYAVLAFKGTNGISRECFWPEDLMARCRG